MNKRPVAFRVPRLCGDTVSHYFVTTSEDEARAMADTNQVEYEGLYLVGDRRHGDVATHPTRDELAQLVCDALWGKRDLSFRNDEVKDAGFRVADALLAVIPAPAQAVSEPVARAHITLEDDGPYARLEVLNGERLQPSMSPVDLYVEPPVGWSMTPLGRPVYTPPPVSPSSAGTEHAPYGIIDPEYARVFTMARCLAWAKGYALLFHGSFTRDLDLIAVPWTSAACEPEHLVNRIVAAADLRSLDQKPSAKEHGRLSWTLVFKKFGDPRFIDFSTMPRILNEPQTSSETGGAS